MPVANIIFQQNNDNNLTPGSRDDLVLNLPVTALNQDPTGIISYLWQFIDIPAGSNAVIDFPTNSVIHFTPDIVGTYLLKLTVNSSIIDTSAAAIKTANLAIRLPAAGEITEFGVKGWSRAVEAGFKVLDDGYGILNTNQNSFVKLSPLSAQIGNINVTGNINANDGYFVGDINILEAIDTFGPSTLKIGTGTFGSTTGILIGQSSIDTVMPTNLGMSAGKAIRLEAISTTNWSIGKNLNLFTRKIFDTDNSSASLDVVIANTTNQGIAIGANGASSLFEVRSDGTGYLLNNFVLDGYIDRFTAGSLNIASNTATGGTIGKGAGSTGTFSWGINGAAIYSQTIGQSSILVSDAYRVQIDGYTIDPRGAQLGQALIYNGTKFVPSTLPFISPNVSEFLLTTTAATQVALLSTHLAGNFRISVFFRVITASTNVTIDLHYSDASNTAEVLNMLPLTLESVGNYTIPSILINCNTSPIDITFTAGTANQVYASCVIEALV